MTWTPEYASSIVRHTFDRTSPIAQYATVPRAFVFIQRINLGLYALLGELRATGNYRRMAEELWPFVDGRAVDADGRGRGGVAGDTPDLTVGGDRPPVASRRCVADALAPLAVLARPRRSPLVACGSDDDAGSDSTTGRRRPATVDDTVADVTLVPATHGARARRRHPPTSIPTELVVTELTPGTGKPAADGDTVFVNYVGVRSEDGDRVRQQLRRRRRSPSRSAPAA